MTRILVVEDDRSIVDYLTQFLIGEGFETDIATSQAEATRKIVDNNYDIALLDISLGDGNGFAVCSAIKTDNIDLPVIFLTASDDEYSVVTGFNIGADDYIKKPFRPKELVSRIRAVLRRCGKQQSVIHIGNIAVDAVKGTVTKNNEDVYLSALEYRLLLVLINNRGTLMTRERLLQEIWDASGEFVNDNTLTVYIKRLREKIEDDIQNPLIIKTVRGIGYKVDN